MVAPLITPRVSIKKILLATDFSPCSLSTLPYATEFARQFDATIHVVHVISLEVRQLASARMLPLAFDRVRHYAESQMMKLVRSGRLGRLAYQTTVREGEILSILGQMIDEQQIDLLVIGTQGHAQLPTQAIGPVASQLLHQSPCPVLSVGPTVPADTWQRVELTSIICAVDFSPVSFTAARYAGSLAERCRGRVVLVRILAAETASKWPSRQTYLENVRRRLHDVASFAVPAECQAEILEPIS